MGIPNTIKAKLFLQRIISFLILVLLYFCYWIFLFIIRRYQILSINDIRKQFKSITKDIAGPLLICSNHLTYIDSVVLILAFGSCLDYIFNFHVMPWNFPKTTHMKKNVFYMLISYIGKCVFIDFNNHNRATNQPMNIAKYLLLRGEYIMLFPEGHRGHGGRVDTQNFTYGVGKLIKEVPNIKVLCTYLRGSTQMEGSNFPNKHDKFYCKLKLLDPTKLIPQAINNTSELKIMRDLSKKIIQQLYDMEQEYFAENIQIRQ